MDHNNRYPVKDARRLARKLHSLVSMDDRDFERILNGVSAGCTPIAPDAPVEALLEALSHEELDRRAEAAQRLGDLGERAPVEPLLAALQDKQRYVRAEAARALGKLGRRAPLEPLIKATRDSDGSVRVAAVESLGMLAERTPASVLIVALRDQWAPVREATVLAWGKLGERGAIEIVVAALHDEDKFVRLAALSVLGAAGERAPLGSVIAALGDVQKSVREAAVRTLAGMGQRVPVDMLVTAFKGSKWPPMREGIVQVLDMLGPRVPESILLVALHDEWPPVRAAAELALQKRREQAAAAQIELQEADITRESEDKQGEEQQSAALVSNTILVEGEHRHFKLLSWPRKLLAMCRNIIRKPFDRVTQVTRSIWGWLRSRPATALEQVQIRQIGNGNKMVLFVACVLPGVLWVVLRHGRSLRPRRIAIIVADKVTEVLSSTESDATLVVEQQE